MRVRRPLLLPKGLVERHCAVWRTLGKRLVPYHVIEQDRPRACGKNADCRVCTPTPSVLKPWAHCESTWPPLSFSCATTFVLFRHLVFAVSFALICGLSQFFLVRSRWDCAVPSSPGAPSVYIA